MTDTSSTIFEYGTPKSGYIRSESPIGDTQLTSGVTYEMSFTAGNHILPTGWVTNADNDFRLKPQDSPLFGVVTEKCNISYIRIDELKSESNDIVSRTLTVQFEYNGTETPGLIRNIMRRLVAWGDIYGLEMVEPETMTVMSMQEETSPVVYIAVVGISIAALCYILTK